MSNEEQTYQMEEDTCKSPKLTQKAIVSQHYGFGSLELDNLGIEQINNKTTGLEASGKFQEKLMLKQRVQEELLMENRLRKLAKEQEHLNLQINIANKQAAFAEDVTMRREQDHMDHQAHLANLEEQRQRQQSINASRKEENEMIIKQHQDHVQNKNLKSRQEVKDHTDQHDLSINQFRNNDISNKQYNAAHQYQNKKESTFKKKQDKDDYLKSIQSANQAVKKDLSVKKSIHEQKLNQLNQLEERMIGELQQTLQRKQQAVDNLQSKSPALKKQMEPRKAYKYKSKTDDSSFNGTQTGFGTTMTSEQKMAAIKAGQIDEEE